MKRRTVSLLVAVSLSTLLAGCTTVAQTGYESATDKRAFTVQASDKRIYADVKSRLLDSPVKGTGWLDLYCRNAIVVLAGVVEPGSHAGTEAVKIARAVEGVKKVETFFVPNQPSKVKDFTIKQKINAKLLADPHLLSGQVDLSVLAGHVVFIGVVANQRKADEVIAHAKSTDGVIGVKSFIQISGK